MGTLAVPRELVSQTNPTEAQFDTMRTYLLGFFNADSLDEDNIEPGSLSYSKLAAPADGESIDWHSVHFTMLYDDSNDLFLFENTEGDILWAHRISDMVLEEFASVRAADGALECFGIPEVNTSVGSQVVQLLWLLARYRKPKLWYVDANTIKVEENSTTNDETVVMIADRLLKVYDRTLAFGSGANGETTGDTGTAVSGMGAGLTRAANTWYYIYAVEVQYGTQNDGTYAVLVASTTSPLSANIDTLDTAFGVAKWVYLGCVRNGYNVTGLTNVIIPFIYDEHGYMRFTASPVDNEPIGLRLAAATSDENLEFALTFGAGTTDIPPTVTRAIIGGYRSQYGFELQYVSVATSEMNAITTGCYHVGSLTTLVPAIYLEVPAIDGYKAVIRVGSNSTNQRVTLAGLVDHYL